MDRVLKEKGLKSWAEAASAAVDSITWKQRGSSPIIIYSPLGEQNNDDDEDQD